MKTIKIETYLPLFPGFYGTLFESIEDMEIDDVNSQRERKGMKPVNFDTFEFDYKEYEENVSLECVNAIESKLSDLIGDISIKFQELHSPKEYNFANDSIYVEMTLTKKAYDKMIEILESEEQAFKTYIRERYTSRDGFMSSYSSNSETWLKDLKTKNKDTFTHQLAASLEFILTELEEYSCDNLYEDIETHTVFASNYYELIEQ